MRLLGGCPGGWMRGLRGVSVRRGVGWRGIVEGGGGCRGGGIGGLSGGGWWI